MMTRLTVTLRTDEREALLVLALSERRDLRDQAAVMLRDALIQRGLLSADRIPIELQSAQAVEIEHERAA